MTDPRAVRIALELQLLGVSGAGVVELLSQYPYEQIERQLSYLPFRKAKRPEAFIMDAVRNDYSPPKEFFYASTQTAPSNTVQRVDQDTERHPRSPDAVAQGYGATSAVDLDPTDDRMEPGGPGRDLAIPGPQGQDGPT